MTEEEDGRRIREAIKQNPLLELYRLYAPTVVRITSKDAEGDLSNGAGFHIGDGYIATARHVVENRDVTEVIPHRDAYPLTSVKIEQTFLPKDERVDVAVLKTDFSLAHYMSDKVVIRRGDAEQVKTDVVSIGSHLDDWLGNELTMTQALVMGFPRVPLANDANLVAVRCEVNAVIDKYNGPHPHFIVSSVPRGGFSGGPCLSEYGFLLGIVTESLVADGKDLETGFTSVISIEPLINLLLNHQIFPAGNVDLLRELNDPGGVYP